jgi:hypothetical protein
MSEDEGALYIATLYYCGLVQNGLQEKAEHLFARIQSVVEFGVPRGLISPLRWSNFSEAIRQADIQAGIE